MFEAHIYIYIYTSYISYAIYIYIYIFHYVIWNEGVTTSAREGSKRWVVVKG